jgi:hypothetical protein
MLTCLASAFGPSADADLEKEHADGLASVRAGVAENERLMSLIRMDYEIVYEMRDRHVFAAGRASTQSFDSFSHARGTWAQDGDKQHVSGRYVDEDGKAARSMRTMVCDGKKTLRAADPSERITVLRRFTWPKYSPPRFALRPYGHYRLSEMLSAERAKVLPDPEIIDGRECRVVEIKRPHDGRSIVRVWLDAERMAVMRLRYYRMNRDNRDKSLVGDVDSIRLHRLSNGGWVPIEGVSRRLRGDRTVERVRLRVDPKTIAIARKDIPGSLFTFNLKAGVKIHNSITGHTVTVEEGDDPTAVLERTFQWLGPESIANDTSR